MSLSPMRGTLGAVLLLVLPAAAAGDETADTFQSLFGSRIAEVKRTVDRKDDAALVAEMLAAARKATKQPALVAMICDAAYALALPLPAAHASAVDCMNLLADVIPDRAHDCRKKTLAIRQRAYRESRGFDRIELGEEVLDSMLMLADSAAAMGEWTEAASHCQQALMVAGTIKSLRRPEAQNKLAYVIGRRRFVSQIEVAKLAVKNKPQDPVSRDRLVTLLLVEMDRPAEAAKYVAKEMNEDLAANVPLAAKDADALSDAECLKLAEWYRSLAARASPDGKVHVHRQAAKHYGLYLAKHPDEDLERTKVTLALKQVEEFLATTDAPAALQAKGYEFRPAILTFVRLRSKLKPEERLKVTVAKLTEYNGGNRVVVSSWAYDRRKTKIAELSLAGLTEVRSIEPLYGMEFESLRLSDCPNLVGDLRALKGMPLTCLNLAGCKSLESLRGIEGAPLTRLELGECAGLAGDLEVLKGMPLTRLGLLDCASLVSLHGIEGAPLKAIEFTGCRKLRDISALKGMKFSALDLTGCESIESLAGLQGMPLTSLVLRNCKKLGPDLSAMAGTKLDSLRLTDCDGLESLTGIEGAPLKRLTVSGCPKLKSIKALRGAKLTVLILEETPALESLDGLQDMPLTQLSLTNAASLKDLAPLAEVAKLTSLSINNGQKLTRLDGILSLPLKSVHLRRCPNLTEDQYMRLVEIGTLERVNTGDYRRDAELAKAIQPRRGPGKRPVRR